MAVKVFLQRILAPLRALFGKLTATGGGAPLCDTCKWDYGDACKRPERPNAMTCPDYKRR